MKAFKITHDIKHWRQCALCCVIIYFISGHHGACSLQQYKYYIYIVDKLCKNRKLVIILCIRCHTKILDAYSECRRSLKTCKNIYNNTVLVFFGSSFCCIILIQRYLRDTHHFHCTQLCYTQWRLTYTSTNSRRFMV